MTASSPDLPASEDATIGPHYNHGPIHTWFGLNYSSYLVLQRSVLQAMPAEWQERFVGMLHEIGATLDVDDMPAYWVRAKDGNRFLRDRFSNYRRPEPIRRRAAPDSTKVIDTKVGK
jgi:hypothetical protein